MTEVPNPDEAELPTTDDDTILGPEPETIRENVEAIKDAQEQLGTLDVLVCGQCHSVFHFIEEFTEHRDSVACSGKSPIRDSTEQKPQVWAFLLWKCSLPAVEVGASSGWRLYQQWCRMPAQRREAWLTAGKVVQDLTKLNSNIDNEPAKIDVNMSPKSVSTNAVNNSTAYSAPRRRGRPPKRRKDDDIAITGTEIIDQADHDKQRLLATLEGNDEDDPKASIIKKLGSDITIVKNSIKDKDMAGAQDRVPIADRMAKRSDRPKDSDDDNEPGEFVVEKILAKRFNPKKKQHEYLLKWEGYPHESNTWEPVENMETCRHLLDAFEKQLARQKEMKAMRSGTGSSVDTATPVLTPTGRLQRSSKVRAMDCVKAWCGAGAAGGDIGDEDDLPPSKKIKKENSSDDEDFKIKIEDTPNLKMLRVSSDSSSPARNVNGTSGKFSDSEINRSMGIGGKGMPNIKGVIKVDPKHIPSLSTGIYIMSKNSGIMKIDTPGKLGPGLNIDQDLIRKQIFAAKQASIKKKLEAEAALKNASGKSSFKSDRPQIIEKTIITPSGQKIIQRTIQRPSNANAHSNADGTTPMTILNKKLAQSQENSLLRRVVPYRGRGRGASNVLNSATHHITKVKDRNATTFLSDLDFEPVTYDSDSSDGITDPFPADLGPIPPPSPERELTLDPETGKRLARAEGEPTPPPTPPPPATPPPEPPVEEPPTATYLMKVEVSPGGTTGMVVQSNTPQQSLPSLLDDEVKLETSAAVKKLFTEDEDEENEQNAVAEAVEGSAVLGSGESIMIRGEDGVLYQIAGENEEGQTLLVAADSVEGAEGAGVAAAPAEGAAEEDGAQCVYVTQNDTGEVLTLDPSQFAQLIPDQDGNGGTLATTGLQQVAVQVEGEGGEDSTQVIAQLVQADLPSPGGTRRVVLLLPDGSFTMTELDREQYESITEAGKTEE